MAPCLLLFIKEWPILVILFRNTQTAETSKTEFSIEIFEGNNPLAKENKSIKEYTVAMRPCPRGQALIEIKFDINDQGILTFEHTVKND